MPQLSEQPYFHHGVDARNSTFGRYCEIGEGSVILQSTFDDYSYCGRFADIAYSKIGKFSNIAAFVRINPGEHPHERASLHHFMYRSSYYWPDEQDEARIFEW
jgi:acetyltransferase-like isoleucine patch superfamily enzyme